MGAARYEGIKIYFEYHSIITIVPINLYMSMDIIDNDKDGVCRRCKMLGVRWGHCDP